MNTRLQPARRPAANAGVAALAVALAAIGCAPPGPRLPAERAEALRRSMELPSGGMLGLLVAGDAAGPRVVLVHGTPGSAASWSDYLLEPPAGAEVVALDRPGFGRSGPDGAVTSLAAQAEAVAALLPADGRRAVLVGHSMGGPIVARVAAEHPAQVQALVLVAASMDPAQERIHPMQPIGAWAPVRALLPRAIRNANAELMALRGELEALAPLLPRITAPVLVLHGERDPLVPVANVDWLVPRLTGARCVVVRRLPEADHFLPWNADAELRAAIAWGLEPRC